MAFYKTVGKAAGDEFTEKRSRFIGYAAPVQTEEEAVRFISDIRAKHWDAKHNVYAYSLRAGQQKRYSDDGEPKGTAGVPVLDVLQKGEVVDAVLVVTRYFGGVLLGTGGLVRAYSHAAALAVAAAGIVTVRRCAVCELRCDYTRLAPAQAMVGEAGRLLDQEFGADVKLTFLLPEEETATFETRLLDAFCGRVAMRITGYDYHPF